MHSINGKRGGLGGVGGGGQLRSWWMAASYNPSTITYPKMSIALKNRLPTTQLTGTGTSTSELSPSEGISVKPKFCHFLILCTVNLPEICEAACSKSSSFSLQKRGLPTLSLHKQVQPLKPVAVGCSRRRSCMNRTSRAILSAWATSNTNTTTKTSSTRSISSTRNNNQN